MQYEWQYSYGKINNEIRTYFLGATYYYPEFKTALEIHDV